MLEKHRVFLAIALTASCGAEDPDHHGVTSADAGTDPPTERDALPARDVVDRDVVDRDATDRDATDGQVTNPSDGHSPEASPVVPIEQAGRYVFSSGDVTLEVDSRVGGRVTSFALAGQNLLTGSDVDPGNYGSTFWTSPQSDWGWPPITEIDNQPYAAVVQDSKLVLTGMMSPRLGIAVTKTFAFDASKRSAQIEYVIRNQGNAPRTLAPWEVTRVRPNGLTFFPTGQGNYSYGSVPLATQDAAGMTWFDYDAATISADSKFYADGQRGLMFHVAADGAVFVKKFPDAPGANHAPNEGEIEIYANGAHTYIELENQGTYTAIGPGESMSWRVEWFLRKLPDGVAATVGNPALIDFVESVAQ